MNILKVCSDLFYFSNRFNHSASSLWPAYLTIYNIDKRYRLRRENLLVITLFNGKTVPVNTIIEPLALEVAEINKGGGMDVGNKKLKVFVLTGSFDSVARPKFMNHKQFNGNFGCNGCLHPGISVGKSMKYPNK